MEGAPGAVLLRRSGSLNPSARPRTDPKIQSSYPQRKIRDRDLQREIEDVLNVMESWNRANGIIFYGKGGDIATNRRDERELSVLCLRILQAALVYVNTLMLQDVLADPEWADVLTEADLRGLTPLFWTHVRPYGEVKLDMSHRLELSSSGGTVALATAGVA